MSGKTIFEAKSPKTQSVEAAKALLSWQGKRTEPLPRAIPLGDAQLTLSNKGDVYYMTTATACSCPARQFSPGQSCKHMKALLAGNSREAARAQARAYQARQRELRAKAQAAPSMPEPAEGPRKLAVPPDEHVAFKPFLEDRAVAEVV